MTADVTPELSPVETVCVHHWRLDPPIGEVTHALCLVCGCERDFREVWHGHYNQQRRPR